MDLTRTRRMLQRGKDEYETYARALTILDTLNIIREDAEEALEDQMRVQQQSITTDDVRVFVERSVEHLTQALLELSDTEALLKLIIEHDKDAFENALSSIRKQIDEERAEREKWALIGDDLGDLNDHPF